MPKLIEHFEVDVAKTIASECCLQVYLGQAAVSYDEVIGSVFYQLASQILAADAIFFVQIQKFVL